MQSASSRASEIQLKQAALQKQIASLQSELNSLPPADRPVFADSAVNSAVSPKRKRSQDSVLVPSTPSPAKKRKTEAKWKQPVYDSGKPLKPHPSAVPSGPTAESKRSDDMSHVSKPGPSTLISKLAMLHAETGNANVGTSSRSTSFSGRPPRRPNDVSPQDEARDHTPVECARRDDRLALVEDLEMGPYDHKAPWDDPNFEKLEPNSGITLSSRKISHGEFQDFLRGRYYISPSRLYSVIRLLPNKQGYDVPTEGDWVTVAVVAERGPIKYSKAPSRVVREDGDADSDDSDDGKPGRKASQKKEKASQSSRPKGKKYVSVKLVDFGGKSRSCSSATGGKAVIRGDAQLTLLLFESDSCTTMETDGGGIDKIYKGGSRGAFEAMSKVKEGDVVAILNAKVLKPFQRSASAPHPTSNILALTPESEGSVAVIGRSQDLGMCTVVKKDGKACGSWYDRRVSDVCDWHLQNAVQRRKASRPEFSIGTSGLSTSVAVKRQPAYDPARQWGLKPSEDTPAATYVVSGHVVNGSESDCRSLFASENIGREGQAKAARRMHARETEKALRVLLDRDKEGMQAVVSAREAAKKAASDRDLRQKKGSSKTRARSPSAAMRPDGNHQKAYSADVIKKLGFDPTLKGGHHRRIDDSTVEKKLEALAATQASRRDISLAPRPGQRIRSGVFAPQAPAGPTVSRTDGDGQARVDESMIDLDDSDDGM